MTSVCLVGNTDVQLRYELVSRETSREALSTHDLSEPFHNTVSIETISLGAAVSLLNDLDWYLTRFVRDALVLEPSISSTEWLSRNIASAIRDTEIQPADSERFLKVYGIQNDSLVEPMYVTRTGDRIPDYDLQEVDDTLVVRVTEDEFGP